MDRKYACAWIVTAGRWPPGARSETRAGAGAGRLVAVWREVEERESLTARLLALAAWSLAAWCEVEGREAWPPRLLALAAWSRVAGRLVAVWREVEGREA